MRPWPASSTPPGCAQSVFDTLVHLLGAPVLPYLSVQTARAVTNFSFNVK